MTPSDAIADLDRELAERGEPVRLQRLNGAARIPVTVECLAFVTPRAQPEALVDGVLQRDYDVVLSPTAITAAGWPGAAPRFRDQDPRVPIKGDRILTARGPLTVQVAFGRAMGVPRTLVRIDAIAGGGLE